MFNPQRCTRIPQTPFLPAGVARRVQQFPRMCAGLWPGNDRSCARSVTLSNGTEHPIADGDIDTLLQCLQAVDGGAYWAALDRRDPFWLEHVYKDLALGRGRCIAA
jgi:hypothetical protein